MGRQKSEVEEFFRAYDEQALATQAATLPWCATMPLAAAIVHGPVKWLAAYKLDRRPTARTRQASAREDDPGVPVEHWEIPHAPLGHIMDLDHELATPAAALRIPGYGAQS